MKKLLLLTMVVTALQVKSQLLVNLQLPPNGVMQKGQLWNMTVTNTAPTTLSVHIELMFTDLINSMQVMSAATPIIAIAPGATQLNNSLLQPIQYNVMSQFFAADISPNGLLPVGDFEVCYSFMAHYSDVVEKIGEECQELIIEPLSPPQLVYPYDQSVIETKNPQFTWLAPMPVNLFTNLKYDLHLVEVFPNQSPADAVQQNPPVYHLDGVVGSILPYPVSAPALELNKQYCWRIIAKSNEAAVGQSETWTFSIKEFSRVDTIQQSELPFAKLKKDDKEGYAIFVNAIKFDYLNENADSSWNLTVYDLSTAGKEIVMLPMDSIILMPGQNLVICDVKENPEFIDKHLYLMEIINSRTEVWRLRFEYRRSGD